MQSIQQGVSKYDVQQATRLLWVLVAPLLAVSASVLLLQGEMLLVAAVLLALVGIWLLAHPDLATLLVIFVLYTNAAVVAVKFHSMPFFVAAATPLLLLWPLLHRVVMGKEKLLLPRPLWPLLFFVLVQLAGILAADRPDIAADEIKVVATECLLLYVLVTNVVRTEVVLRRVVWVLVLAGALMGAMGIFQQLSNTHSRHYGGFAQVPDHDPTASPEKKGTGRFAGPIGEKNYFAQFMLLLLPLAMFRARSETSRTLRIAAVIACLFIAFGVALTQSRGAAVGFAAMLLVMFGMGYVTVRHLALTVVGITLLFIAVPEYGTRLLSVTRAIQAFAGPGELQQADKATQGRLTEMAAAALVFIEHPVIGVGPGMFPYHFLDKADSLGFQVHGTTRIAHCAYLEIAAEHGLLGLLAFLAIWFVTLRDLAHTRATASRPEIVNTATGFILALAVLATTGAFLSLAYVRYYWLVLALAASVSHVYRLSPTATGSLAPASDA